MSYKLNKKVYTDTEFFGTVVLPTTTTIGDVSSAELARLDGVTSPIQTQLDNKQPLSADLTAIDSLSGTSGLLKKTGADTWVLDTSTYLTGNQNISLSGDATGSGSTSIAVTLANSGVTAGSYGGAASVASITVDSKGRVTSASNTSIAIAGSAITSGTVAAARIDTAIARLASPALSGTPTAPTPTAGDNSTKIATTAYVQTEVGAIIDAAPEALNTLNELAAALGDDANFATSITNSLAEKQPLDADLTAIAGLTGTSGLLKKTAADTWTLDTNSYLTSVTLSGDVTGTGSGTVSTTLANTAVTAGSYGTASQVATFTVDSKGRLTNAGNTNIAISGSAITSGTVAEARIDSSIARLASPSFTGTITTQGRKLAYASKSAAYTLTTSDDVVNGTSGTWTATLPTSVGATGQEYTIKNSGTGTITVACTSSQTIDGDATVSLGQYEAIRVVSNGANWIVV